MAASYGKLEVFQGICNWAAEDLTREEANKLLFAIDNNGRSVFRMTEKFCETELFQGICNWAAENLTREETEKCCLPKRIGEGPSFV